MKILVSAGGTGGHIYPALAIIDKFKEKEKDLDIIYVGTTNRMEKDIIPQYNIKYIPIEIYGLTKNIIHDIKNIYLIKKNINKMIKLMKEFKPDIVLCIGGYVTFPVIIAAKKLGIKIFMHEQNAIPGKVNRLTEKYASLIGVSFKESIKYFKNKNVFYSGNPTSSRALKINKISKESLGFNKNKKLIVMVAGSLGSSSVNSKCIDFLKKVQNKEYQVLYITGKNYYNDFTKEKFSDNVIIKPYIDNLPGVLKDASLLISRAGASTIAEILALNIPSILIPSPYVANNHQYFNALDIKNNNCGMMLEEKDFTTEKLISMIDDILEENKYNMIKNNLVNTNVINSDEIIYDKIKEILNV